MWGTFLLLPHVRCFMPPWHAPFPALPSQSLCPPARASTMRSIARGNAPSLPPLSAPAPWPCPAPYLLALPRPPLPPFPGPLVPGSLSPCPRPPFTLPAYTSRSNTRGIPPTPSSPCLPLVPWSLGLWHARRTAPACGLCPSTPGLPPPPSLALFPLGHYAGQCVGKLQACRRHAPGRRAGWHHAVAARRCHSPRRSRGRGQPLQMPRGARPWYPPAAPRPGFHCTPRGAWSPGGIHHKILQDMEKK